MQPVEQQVKEADGIVVGHFLRKKYVKLDAGGTATQMFFKMKQETRGRKTIPDNEKKIPVVVYIKSETIDKLGGKEKLKQNVTNYIHSLTK